ncbi:MAG: hypothetical protein HZA51_04110 [Planctomycetes bacterium]|nr:hypothetical protein [Planctomycetota bacterium]
MQFLDRTFGYFRGAAPSRWFWLGLPLLLYSWTITGPLLSDDMHMILKCERFLRGETASPELFRFARTEQDWNDLRTRGTVPWWMPEQGRQDFFRPLSEWSFLGGVQLFGRNVIGHRLVSLGVFALAVLAVHWMFRQVRFDALRAGAAAFFFGISQTVTAPTVWMCNRSEIQVVLGVALAAGAYWAAWNRPRAWHLPLALIGFLFAILSKEVAIALPAVIVAHELIVRVRRDERFRRPHNAYIAIAMCVIAAGYLAYYRYSRPWAFDWGSTYAGSAVYGTGGILSILLYVAVWTIGFPIDALLTATAEQNFAVALVAALLVSPTLLYVRRSAKNDPAALFFALWAVLFMLPCLKSIAPSSRYLCAASIGWFYLVAGMILPSREEDVIVPRPLRHLYLASNGIVSVACMVGTVLFINQAEVAARARIEKMAAACLPPLTGGEILFATQADSIVDNICSGDRLEYITGLRDVSLVYLLPPGIGATTEVEDDHTLLVRATDQSLLGARVHRLAFPRDWTPKVGQTFSTKTFTAEVASVRSGEFVDAMRVRFKEPLTSRRLRFFPADLNSAAKSVRSVSAVPTKGA